MKKKQLLATLALSTLVLAQAGFVSAEELTPVDASQPATELVTTTEISNSETVTDPTTPIDSTAPSTDVTPPSTDQGKDSAGDNMNTPEPTPPQGKDDAGDKVDVTDPTRAPAPQGKDDAGDKVGTEPSTPGTTDPSNGSTDQENPQTEEPRTSRPIPEPTLPFNPFETQGGQTVVGTQNSQVIIQQADGTTSLVAPEAIGGTTNADGTVTVTAASGEKKTLPQTGDETGSLLSLLGTSLLMGLGLLKKKKML